MAHQVSAIIPAYNEADLIADTVGAVLGIPGVSEVVVVDDGSIDGTADAARDAGAHRVIVLKENCGKGGALNAAWPGITSDILLLLDADLGASASEGHKLLSPVLADEADMTIAIFGGTPVATDAVGESKDGILRARSGGFGTVVRSARSGIKCLTGTHVTAPLSGSRAVRREIIEKAGGFAPKFGVEVALTIDTLRMGYKIAEVPVAMVHRASGRDFKGFMHRGRQFFDVVRSLTVKAIRR